MGMRFVAAKAVSAASTWGLKNVFRRPAANFPGKIALYVDPQVIADLRPRMTKGSICVVGTNGKTTVTNLLADAIEAAGMRSTCNRTGANLDSGVATALLHTGESDWGVFECDELWLAKILPFLQSDYVVLLNLFRDQLDRIGEIEYIQDSIAGCLAKSPATALVYNADDPVCQAIADRVDNPKVPFGLECDLGLPQNTVIGARMCQRCDAMLDYRRRQYDQLGDYKCPSCDFHRPTPVFSATNVVLSEDGVSFDVCSGSNAAPTSAPLVGAYMAYNLLAVWTAGLMAGLPFDAIQEAIRRYDPKNGRLQEYVIAGRPVLTNLAKNPTGFNQNLKIVLQGEGQKAVGFFVNDKEGDGRDVSWLWDIDFQELATQEELVVFAGGIRRNDIQVRLKYAGIDARLVDGAEDMLAQTAALLPDAKAYLIANYTALPIIKAELDELEETGRPIAPCADSLKATAKAEVPGTAEFEMPGAAESAAGEGDRPSLTIAHMLPSLLNLNGDGGNVTILADRARRRGIDVTVVDVEGDSPADFSDVDIVFMAGGPDREQRKAADILRPMAEDLKAYVEDDGVVLAINGGYQLIGRTWLLGGEVLPGLGLVGAETRQAKDGARDRFVNDALLDSDFAETSVVGYENHSGRTTLDEGAQPFGRVQGRHGNGNNGNDGTDGIVYRNVVGSYLHGPLLAKNPEVADALLERALARRARKFGVPAFELSKLDDSVEMAANEYMVARLGGR